MCAPPPPHTHTCETPSFPASGGSHVPPPPPPPVKHPVTSQVVAALQAALPTPPPHTPVKHPASQQVVAALAYRLVRYAHTAAQELSLGAGGGRV